MKVILKEDVHKLGSLGDEVDVKPGFARNYLLPQGKALLLTRGNVKQINHLNSILAKKRADAIDQAKGLAKKLEDLEIIFKMKSGESGKLFGSVTQKHIFEALAEQGVELDRKKLNISAPIKTLGKHKILIKLHTAVVANLEVGVVAEAVEATEGDEEPSEESNIEAAVSEETAEAKETQEQESDSE